MADKFSKFNKDALVVLNRAQQAARHFKHNSISADDLLLGLLWGHDNLATQILDNVGVKLSTIHSTVEYLIKRGNDAVTGEFGLTPRGKKIIELTVDEANMLKHDYIGPEHLLLGMIREGEGIAGGVLHSYNVTLEKTRERVRRLGSSGQI